MKKTSRVKSLRFGRSAAGEKARLGFCLVIISLVWCVIVGRLWNIQVVSGKTYAQIAAKQATDKIPLPAERGVIYDRTGKEVAVNVIRHSLWVYPQSDEEKARVGIYLDKLLGYRPGMSIAKHKIQTRRFRWIKRGVSDKLARRVAADTVPGVFIRQERGREYPYGLIGKQILGFTDSDNKGISGLEARYNEVLSGRDGVADIRRDGFRNAYQVIERPLSRPRPGGSLILTIDWMFQEIVEEELMRAVENYNALSGDAVFVDCATGELLAVAHCNPQDNHQQRPTKLPPVTDSFEPGSIYKVITAAALLDKNIAGPSRVIDCEGGAWQVGRRTLHDDKEHGEMTFHNIMAFSSNIGIAKLAIELGGEKLVSVSRRFGIGQKTRVDFPGEQRGKIRTDVRWSDYNVSALSIGHSVAVTPLQMALATAAIANGGSLYRPRFARGIVGADGLSSELREPEKVAQALSARSARQLRRMLRSVVDTGTAQLARSTTIGLAGKTGTAEIPREDGKGYYKNRFNASFIGYFPADSPLIAGIVVLKRPEPVHYGGHTSAPAFRKMAERYALANPGRFSSLHKNLDINAEDRSAFSEAPRLIGLTAWAARQSSTRKGFTLKGMNDDGDVIWQYPSAGEPIQAGASIVALTNSMIKRSRASSGMFGMSGCVAPDLLGVTTRQASLLLAQLHIPFDLDGSGRIIRQRPEAGSIMQRGEVAYLSCESPEAVP